MSGNFLGENNPDIENNLHKTKNILQDLVNKKGNH